MFNQEFQPGILSVGATAPQAFFTRANFEIFLGITDRLQHKLGTLLPAAAL